MEAIVSIQTAFVRCLWRPSCFLQSACTDSKRLFLKPAWYPASPLPCGLCLIFTKGILPLWSYGGILIFNVTLMCHPPKQCKLVELYLLIFWRCRQFFPCSESWRNGCCCLPFPFGGQGLTVLPTSAWNVLLWSPGCPWTCDFPPLPLKVSASEVCATTVVWKWSHLKSQYLVGGSTLVYPPHCV